MSSSSAENDSGGEESTINGEEDNSNGHTSKLPGVGNGAPAVGNRIVELLQEERGGALTPEPLGNVSNRYHDLQQTDGLSEDGSLDGFPQRAGSPVESFFSVPDDSPSVQVSIRQSSQIVISNTCRAQSSLLLAEAAYYHQLLLDLVLRAQRLPSDPSTDDSNLASPAPH
jgi:hypothetical protein